MRRRDFIKAITATVATCPLAARAQHSVMPVIAFLRSTSAVGYLPSDDGMDATPLEGKANMATLVGRPRITTLSLAVPNAGPAAGRWVA